VQVLGIHVPEFPFAKDVRQVQAAARRLGIPYPILLDNEYANWDAFANRYWPTVYLIDAHGYIRAAHSGEGGYEEKESALRALILEMNPNAALPPPVGVLRAEDESGAVCFRTTPELHAGYDRGALGNPEGYAPRGQTRTYELPPHRQDGFYYAAGVWQAAEHSLALVGEAGALVLPYHAATGNAVMAPALDLENAAPLTVRVSQDGAPLTPENAGADIFFEHGQSYVRVDAARSYQLAKNPNAQPHELKLEISQSGLVLYAFSFSTCTVVENS
jgi:hypothetical protein